MAGYYVKTRRIVELFGSPDAKKAKSNDTNRLSYMRQMHILPAPTSQTLRHVQSYEK